MAHQPNSDHFPDPHQSLISVLDELDIGMALLDHQGKIQWGNRHLYLWFPPKSKFLEAPCKYLCEIIGSPCCIHHAQVTRQKSACEYEKIEANGELKNFLVSVYPLDNLESSPYSTILLLHDISLARQETHEAQRTALLQEAIYQIAAASSSVKSLAEMYAVLHEIIGRIMPADNFYIALQDPQGTEIHFPYFVDEIDARPNYTLPADNKSITSYVLHTGKSLLCTKDVSLQLADQGVVEMYGPEPETWLGVPLIVENQSIGVMAVQHYTDPHAYTKRELKLLEFVSAEVAKVILAKRGEAALLQAERRFRNIVEEAPMGFHQYILDSDGTLTFTFTNKTGNNSLRNNCKQFTGLPIEQAFPLLENVNLTGLYHQIAAEGGTHQAQVTQTENGKMKAVYELYAFQTIPHQMAVLIQNITERLHTEKALLENERRIRNITDASPLGLLIYHLTPANNLILVEANPSASKILKLDCQKLIGKTLVEAFPNFSTTKIPQIYRDLAKNGGTFSNQQFSYKDDKMEGAFELYAFQISPNRIALMFQDITGRLQQERKIKELNESLEGRVRQRTAEMEAFAYSVSHDLRAPVRAIKGFTEMITQDQQNQFTSETQDLLKRILDSSQKMDDLINDLLALSHLGSQQINFKTINLSELLRDIYGGIMIDSPQDHVTLQIEETPSVYADRNQMEIMLTNLLTNAIKFSRKAPNPTIQFGSVREGDQIKYFLKDNGIGFDMEYKKKIFTPFERLNPSEYKGTGIGLAIVYRVIQQHKGEIWVNSVIGEGTTFFFSLPPMHA